MLKPRNQFRLSNFAAIGMTAGLICTCEFFNGTKQSNWALANPSMFEYRWNNSTNYKKLYYWQSSKERRDRSTYYLVLRPNDRKTAINKLKITIPTYFDAKITPKKLSLCRATLGGMLTRTKCVEKIPATFEVSQNNSAIEVFPSKPIPVNSSYAVVMKIFNPNQTGMFQLNAMAQSPGEIPISGYLGSWSIDIN